MTWVDEMPTFSFIQTLLDLCSSYGMEGLVQIKFCTCQNWVCRERIFSFEGGGSRLHYMEASFWRRLWTCRQTEYWMNDGQLYVFIQESPVEAEAPTHWNLISHSMTFPVHVLSSSSILLPPSSHVLAFPQGKKYGAYFKNVIVSISLLFLKF